MKFADLLKMYEKLQEQFGDKAYMHVSEMLEQAREIHRGDYLNSTRAEKLRQQGRLPDAEQSWKGFKGKNFEKLILHIIRSELSVDDLRCIPGDTLRRNRLKPELEQVYRNLLVRYGDYCILPDVDLVVYRMADRKVLGIISCKITLRERIAQTAYWKLKLASNPYTMHIKGMFVTTDEDGDLLGGLDANVHAKSKRNRIIVEHDLDGTYVLRQIAESERVRPFSKLIEYISELAVKQ